MRGGGPQAGMGAGIYIRDPAKAHWVLFPRAKLCYNKLLYSIKPLPGKEVGQ